ncbi:MAG: DALR anticodon-binding domain-containing protein, partial [bacterium]|nr:DALR anticodon-binding domain-containing protein [bacterium]
ESTKKLILKLEEFKSVIEAASRLRAPYMLCKYAQELACDLHHFYNFTRVLTDDRIMSNMRLLIVYAVKVILAQTFNLIRVSAPEKM